MKGGKPFISIPQNRLFWFKERLVSRFLYHFLYRAAKPHKKMMSSLQVNFCGLATFRVSKMLFDTLSLLSGEDNRPW